MVDSTGDNLLAEFASVVDAVQCAVQIQEDLKAKNEELPDTRKMEFRIGINLGDVIQEGDRIYGDGVNVAARIESLADVGGICISRSSYDQVERKLNFKYEYLGEHQVKNIDESVRVYKVLMESISDEVLRKDRSRESVVESKMAFSLTDKPSIAVLPFVNMSNDPEQEYFSDGMAEELIGALAKLEGLKVISRTSAFHFKGKDTALRTIGENLNVENILEGSVRKAGNKLRISAQLIKVEDDTHLWSDIKTLSLQALKIDEMNADAHALQGFIKSLYEYHWGDAEKHYKRAIELNPGNGEVHWLYAVYLIGVGRANEAIERMKHSVKLDPFSVLHNGLLSLYFYFMGQFEKTITQAYKTLELDPDNYIALIALALTHAAKGMYDEGIKILQPVKNIPLTTASIAYLYGRAGKREEAQKILGDLLDRSKQGYFSPVMIAGIYGSLGNKDKAFEWLEKAFEEHDTVNYAIKLEPMLNDLHSDPRWTKLMEKMGLAD